MVFGRFGLVGVVFFIVWFCVGFWALASGLFLFERRVRATVAVMVVAVAAIRWIGGGGGVGGGVWWVQVMGCQRVMFSSV